MLYINQNELEEIHYEHNIDNGGVAPEKQNIKSAGCGLCCLTMVVNHLTVKDFSIHDCIEAAVITGANRVHGSRMRVMAPYVAEKYGLEYEMTNSVDEAIGCLREGGKVIALMLGDRDGRKGLFTTIGHYITLISYSNEGFCILDPGLYDGKFVGDGKEEKVIINAPFIYCTREVIEEEADKSVASYYLFKRGRAF